MIPTTIPCRECLGEGGPCDTCDDGAAICDQPGCDRRAAERIDDIDGGGPSDWVLCGGCAKEYRDRYRRDDAQADAEVER